MFQLVNIVTIQWAAAGAPIPEIQDTATLYVRRYNGLKRFFACVQNDREVKRFFAGAQNDMWRVDSE